ncbi:MAG: hypothetical protein BHW66_05685 [Akkermansia sp. 54_46]|nr:MAG: hypothetical protein BHW66_05685 [Akkermansia sp. 54_46]
MEPPGNSKGCTTKLSVVIASLPGGISNTAASFCTPPEGHPKALRNTERISSFIKRPPPP